MVVAGGGGGGGMVAVAVNGGAGSKVVVSKAEVNLERLLAACERRLQQDGGKPLAADPKLRGALQLYLAEVAEDEMQPQDASSKAQELKQRVKKFEDLAAQQPTDPVNEVVSILRSTWSAWIPAKFPALDGIADISVERVCKACSTHDGGIDNAAARVRTGEESGAALQPASALRNRHRASSSLRTEALDKSMQSLLSTQAQLQEDLTDEMVSLAAALKQNTLAVERSVQDSHKLVDKAEHELEKNLGVAAATNARATQVHSSTSVGMCLTIGIMFCVCIMFFWMVLIIRMTS
eukprot:jgi/Chlat1/4084/Chrsp26S04141